MSNENKTISVELICRFIESLSPSMDDYLYVYDFQNDFYFISPYVKKRLCFTSHAFHNVVENLQKIVYPDDFPDLAQELSELMTSERNTHNMFYRMLSTEKNTIWINCRGHVIRDDDGRALLMIGCINEIGKKQRADNLSGLLVDASLQLYLDEFQKALPDGYLLRIGLDDLKGINARLGIEYGDMVLRRTAECITNCLAPGHKLYRIVGDEFLVVDFLGGSTADALQLYQDIRQSIEQFIARNNYEVVFTISAGLVKSKDIKDFGESAYSDVMKLTEYSLDEAKHRGRNICYTYRPEDYKAFLKRRTLMLELRQAINHNFKGFDVYFQPLFIPNTHQLFGAEALMRFYSPTFGMVSPSEFIPILEDTALIIPAGRWIMNQALGACKKIQEFIPDFGININLSYVQVAKSSIAKEILAAVNETGINPACVTIELTESGLLESDSRFQSFWGRLKEAGIRLALDDFGTGYSNFHYLAELSPDIIKIDRAFTAEALQNSFEYDMLLLFSKMVHQLNLKVCVEGVETEEELKKVCQLPPEYIQGYYFGRPCPLNQFVDQFVAKGA